MEIQNPRASTGCPAPSSAGSVTEATGKTMEYLIDLQPTSHPHLFTGSADARNIILPSEKALAAISGCIDKRTERESGKNGKPGKKQLIR